ncbi:MAG: hypothetical protein HC888_01280 [Candidatus Competibacteraceae bacterium]|nr:hypothetical protein [Candidatus Competibacteraceae bacterium]
MNKLPSTPSILSSQFLACCLYLGFGAMLFHPCNSNASVIEKPSTEQLRAANEALSGDGILFPADSNVLNVKAFGAVGDGRTDDTSAIQAAYQNTGLIYFPNGTYLISKPIKAPPRQGGVPSRRIIQGQSREGTIIKLADKAPAFSGDKLVSMIVVSWDIAQAFRNSVRDITLDTGVDNPAAVGLEYFASNQGAVDGVTIRSSDPDKIGKIGLLMKGDNGPLLVANLKVIGFDLGVMADANALAVLKKIELEQQRTLGLHAKNKTFIHGLTSNNVVTAIRTEHPFVLIDAELKGGKSDAPAIEYLKDNALIRNVTTSGYGNVLQAPKNPVTGSRIDLWTSSDPVTVTGNLNKTLELPLKETPVIPWSPLNKWQNAAAMPGPGKLEALQQALNSGAETIYFPAGMKFNIHGPVTVPASVKRIIGLESEWKGKTDQNSPGLHFIIEGGSEPLVIEHMDTIYNQLKIINKSQRPLVVRGLHAHTIDGSEGGADIFIEDVVGSFLDMKNQSVWAWQYNIESGVNIETGAEADVDPGPRKVTLDPLPRAAIQNEGGKLFLFGMKTEKNRTKVWNTKNAQSECYTYLMANWAFNPLPMFINQDSKMSVFVHESVRRNAPYAIKLQVIQSGRVTDYTYEGKGINLPLLTSE